MMEKKKLENALTEIRIICAIKHPNIVRYYDAFVDQLNKDLFLVMEYLGGGDMSGRIAFLQRAKTELKEKQIWRYILQISQGLKVLHQHKIIHRDIKPGNLFLSDDYETVKVGDMNTSKIMGSKKLTSTVIGTPFYLAPEIWKNTQYDYRCDVFSMGCVMYELAMLRPPFKAASVEELYKLVKKGYYCPMPKKFSKGLRLFISQCLQINPKIRPNMKKLLESEMIKKQLKEHGDLDLRGNIQPGFSKSIGQMKVPQNMKEVKDALDSFRDYNRGVSQRSFKGKKGKKNTDLRNEVVKTFMKKNYVTKKSSLVSTTGSKGPTNSKGKSVRRSPNFRRNSSHNKVIKIKGSTNQGLNSHHKKKTIRNSQVREGAKHSAKIYNRREKGSSKYNINSKNRMDKSEKQFRQKKPRKSFQFQNRLKLSDTKKSKSQLNQRSKGNKILYKYKGKPGNSKDNLSKHSPRNVVRNYTILKNGNNKTKRDKYLNNDSACRSSKCKSENNCHKISIKIPPKSNQHSRTNNQIPPNMMFSDVAHFRGSNNDSDSRLSNKLMKFDFESVQQIELDKRLQKKSLVPINKISIKKNELGWNKRGSVNTEGTVRFNLFDTNEEPQNVGNLTDRVKLKRVSSKTDSRKNYLLANNSNINRFSHKALNGKNQMIYKHSYSDANLISNGPSFEYNNGVYLQPPSVKKKSTFGISIRKDKKIRLKKDTSPIAKKISKRMSLNSFARDKQSNRSNKSLRCKMMSMEKSAMNNMIIEEECQFSKSGELRRMKFLNSYLNKNLPPF